MLMLRIFFHRLLAVFVTGMLVTITVSGQRTRTSQQTPANSSIITQAGSLLDAGKIDSAIEMLSVASRSRPNDVQVKHLLSMAYYRKGDYANAVENLSSVVRETK